VQRRPPSFELPFARPEDRPTSSPYPTPEAGAGSRAGPPIGATPVISVGELDRRLKRVVEGSTGGVDVGGEIGNLKEVASGHAYFTLKDEREDASIDCVMYRNAPPRARRLVVDGSRVVLSGRATVYAARGRLQFLAEGARPAGRGALLEALDRLRQKLADEGLFAPERKRRLPAEPRVIGVVTSADGAAIHDIVKVAFRRGAVRILLARAPVQGPDAPQRLARALAALGRVPEVDAIILGRGGGSNDDLAAFNHEDLVRAVAASRVPVISAVGHEIDVTLTDLAADARAATPSQAAELVVPDAGARREALVHLRARVTRALRMRLGKDRAVLDRATALLGSPDRLLGDRRQALDEARARLLAAVRGALGERRTSVARAERRLLTRHPLAVIGAARSSLQLVRARLSSVERRTLAARRSRLGELATTLDALSPLSILGRGYAIAVGPSGEAVRDAASVAPGDVVRVRVDRGAFLARVMDGNGGDLPQAKETSRG
jgi:exodeoxyribonuclease VII large subunit